MQYFQLCGKFPYGIVTFTLKNILQNLIIEIHSLLF